MNRLELYLRTLGYLRREQLAQLLYRRLVRPRSRPHRALGLPRLREGPICDFPLHREARVLDRRCLAFQQGPDGTLHWGTAALWRPLRLQLHYFDYLNDASRSAAWKAAAVDAWIAGNPLGGGDGWVPYAVSLRVVNWIKFFLRARPHGLEARWLASLHEQLLWLENNLERQILGNHLLKNGKALVFAGLFFAGADAERWLRAGLAILLEELNEEFLDDGGHYERSPMYHAISVEDVLDAHAYLRAALAPEEPALLAELRERACAGLDFLDALLMPDGAIPLFNDSALGVGPSPAELFAYGAATAGYERPAPPRGLAVKALTASGYFVIRDASSMLVVDCGAAGPRYQPGHAHCDALSYELALAGRRVVVDPGVFDYEPSEARKYARSTAAHNTVSIDGAEQSEMWDVFRVARRAEPLAPSLALDGRGRAAFRGAHDGFTRLAPGLIHHRTIEYAAGVWTFEDRIEGSGRHRVESRVHLHPGLLARLAGGAVRVAADCRSPLAELRADGVALRLERAPCYPSFGDCQEGAVVVMSWEGELPATLRYTIAAPAGL
ncbi:MAG: alginate lyase family protein [Candidatus Baltobacteraceae bacterium]